LAEVIRLREARENVRSKYGALASSAPGPDASVEGPIRVRPEHVSLFKELFGNLYEIQGDATVRLASKTEETAELARACWGKVLNDALSGDLGRTPDSAETESVRPSIPDAFPDKRSNPETSKPRFPGGETHLQRYERIARELKSEYEEMRNEAFAEMRRKGVSSERVRKIESLLESVVSPMQSLDEDGDVKYPNETDALFACRAIDAIREILIRSALEENAKRGDPPIRPRNDRVEDVALCILSGEIFGIAFENKISGWDDAKRAYERFAKHPKWNGIEQFIDRCKEIAIVTLADLGKYGVTSKEESQRLQTIYEIVFGAISWIEKNVETPLGAKTRGEGEPPEEEDRNAGVGRKALSVIKKVVTDYRFYWAIFLVLLVIKVFVSISMPLVYDPRRASNNVVVRYDTFVSHVESSYGDMIFDDHGYIDTDLLDGVTDSDKEKVRLHKMDEAIGAVDKAEQAIEKERIKPFADRSEEMVKNRQERYKTLGDAISRGNDVTHDKSYYSDFVEFLHDVTGNEVARLDAANQIVDPNFNSVHNLVQVAYRNYVDLIPEGGNAAQLSSEDKEAFILEACQDSIETELVYDDGTPMIAEEDVPEASRALARVVTGVTKAAAEKAAAPMEFEQFTFGSSVEVRARVKELRDIEQKMNDTMNDHNTFAPVENAYKEADEKIRGLVDDLVARDAEDTFVKLASNGTTYVNASGLSIDDAYDAAMSTRPRFERLPNTNYRATFSAIMYDARERAQCSAESRLLWCLAEKSFGFFRTLGDYSILFAEAGYGATAMGRELSYTAYAAATSMAVSSIWGMVTLTFAISGLGLIVARPRRGTFLGDIRDNFNDISMGSLFVPTICLAIACILFVQVMTKSNWTAEDPTGWDEIWNRGSDMVTGWTVPKIIAFVIENKREIAEVGSAILTFLYFTAGSISEKLGKMWLFAPARFTVHLLKAVIQAGVAKSVSLFYKGTEGPGTTAEKEARRMAQRRFREWAANAVFAAFIGWLVVSSGGNSRLQIMEATNQRLDKAREFAAISGGFRQPPSAEAIAYGATKWNEVRSSALGEQRRELDELLHVVDKIKDIGVKQRLEKVIMRASAKTRLGKSIQKVIDTVKSELNWMLNERGPFESKKRSEFSKKNEVTIKKFGIEPGTVVQMAISPGAKVPTERRKIRAPSGKSKPPKGKPPKEPGP
jgi:hypothetical protein